MKHLPATGTDKPYRINEQGVFSRTSDNSPCCLQCSKPLRYKTQTVFGPTFEEAQNRVPNGATVTRHYDVGEGAVDKETRWETTHSNGDWGYSSDGYFCSLGCGFLYGVLAAKKRGFAPAKGHPSEIRK
jgi:hypothetical protein